jgi:hypothetical protein
MGTQFKRAKEIDIFDANGNKWEGKKGLVNEANEQERFEIVGVGYKIAQHDEVFEIVDKALNDLQIVHKTSTLEMKEGARLRIDLKFPEIVHTIAEEKIQLWATFDNSYDQSTGLRLEINAYMERTEANLYCSEVISEKLNRYYHRHTKGLEVGMLEGTISKGIEIFQSEIGKEFNQLAATTITGMGAKAFISDLIENKSCKTARKYLDMISEAITNAEDRLTTAWALYSLVSSILTK